MGLVGVLALMLGAGLFRPEFNKKPVAVLSLCLALMTMGSFEWIREAARRPYVINEVMYSNGILKSDVERLSSEGFLKNALWVQNKEVGEDNLIQAGEELFIQQCYICHTVEGMNNDIVAATRSMSYRALTKYIDKIHERRYFMPPFVGNESEVKALSAYIAGGIHGKEIIEQVEAAGGEPVGTALFDEHCASCHAPEDLSPAFEDLPVEEIAEMLPVLDEISDEMEPFSGTEKEADDLTRYLYSLNNPGQQAPQENKISGDLLFEDHCSACHDMDEMTGIVEGQGKEEIVSMLGTLDEISDEMEPFSGTEEEAAILAEFLAGANGGDQ